MPRGWYDKPKRSSKKDESPADMRDRQAGEVSDVLKEHEKELSDLADRHDRELKDYLANSPASENIDDRRGEPPMGFMQSLARGVWATIRERQEAIDRLREMPSSKWESDPLAQQAGVNDLSQLINSGAFSNEASK